MPRSTCQQLLRQQAQFLAVLQVLHPSRRVADTPELASSADTHACITGNAAALITKCYNSSGRVADTPVLAEPMSAIPVMLQLRNENLTTITW